LTLPTEVQDLVRTSRLSAGHARALLALPEDVDVVEVARQVVADGLNVREVEKLARQQRPGSNQSHDQHASSSPYAPPAHARARDQQTVSPEVRSITDRLRRYLQTDVLVIADAQSKGELRIRFYSADDLDRLFDLIAGPSSDPY
jgi:ParB family chromosome partitioning protein